MPKQHHDGPGRLQSPPGHQEGPELAQQVLQRSPRRAKDGPSGCQDGQDGPTRPKMAQEVSTTFPRGLQHIPLGVLLAWGAGRKGVRGPGGRSRGGRVHVSLGPAQYLISQGPSSTSGGAKSPQATPRWPKRLQEAPSEASRQAPIANFPSPPNSSNPFSLPSFPYSFLLFPSTCTYACCRVFVVIAITVVSIISPTTTLQCGERV